MSSLGHLEGQDCDKCGRTFPGPDYDGEPGFCVAPWQEPRDKGRRDCEQLYLQRTLAQLSRATAEIAGLKELTEAVRAVRPLLDIWEFDPDQTKVEALDAAMAKLKETPG